MANKCAICGWEYQSDLDLTPHLRVHQIKKMDYYLKYFPRFDKYDNKPIKFKTLIQYLEADFNHRNNMVKWLKGQPAEVSKPYSTNLLKTRKEDKQLLYAPTQAELRTVMLPGMKFYNDLFGDYYKLCSELGFINKFTQYSFEKPALDISRRKIFIDTREQKPLTFNLKTSSKKLDFGDYTLAAEDLACTCFIERKGISDFYGTMSGGLIRFKKELKRAQEYGAYLIVLVEGTIPAVQGFPYLPYVRGKITVTADHLFHNMRELIQEFPNIQFLFVDGRPEASRVIEAIFASNCEYLQCDLQYLYDLKKL